MITLANIGVPMLPIQWMFMLLALVPIILIEGGVAKWKLDLPWKRSLGGSSLSNVISAVLGIPLAWAIMFTLEMILLQGFAYTVHSISPNANMDSPAGAVAAVILGSAWLGPAEDDLGWMIPMALAILLIPSYFLSVWIEYFVCKKMWKECDPRRIWNTTRLSNGLTYGIMIGICFALMALGGR